MRLCVRCKASEICWHLETARCHKQTDRVTRTVCTAWARAAFDAVHRETIEQFMRDNVGRSGTFKAMTLADTRKS